MIASLERATSPPLAKKRLGQLVGEQALADSGWADE
jgi:hypothetical protein